MEHELSSTDIFILIVLVISVEPRKDPHGSLSGSNSFPQFQQCQYMQVSPAFVFVLMSLQVLFKHKAEVNLSDESSPPRQ